MTDTAFLSPEDLVQDSCGAICKSVMPCICLRGKGHDAQHIGMFGTPEETVVVHWGSLDAMTEEIADLMGAEP